MKQDPIKLALDLAKAPLKKKKRKHFEEGGSDHESETKDTETKDTSDNVREGDVPGGLKGDTGEFSQKVDESQGEVNAALAKAQDAQQGLREANFKFGSSPDTASDITTGANSPFANPNFTKYKDTDTSYLFGPSSPSNPPLSGPITTAAGMSTPQLDAANAQFVEQQQLQDAVQAQADAEEKAAMAANNALLMRAGPITGLEGLSDIQSGQNVPGVGAANEGHGGGGGGLDRTVSAPDNSSNESGSSFGGRGNGPMLYQNLVGPSVTDSSDDQRLIDAALSRTGPMTGGFGGSSMDAALSRTGPITGGTNGTSMDAALSRTGPMTGNDMYAGQLGRVPTSGFTDVNANIDAQIQKLLPDQTLMGMTGRNPIDGYGNTNAALRLARDSIVQNMGGSGAGSTPTNTTTGGGTAPSFPNGNVPMPPIPIRDLQGPSWAESAASLFGLSTQQQMDKFYKQYEDQGLDPLTAYNKAISDIQTMRANAKPGPFDKHGYVEPATTGATAPVTPAVDTTQPHVAPTLPGVATPYVPPNTVAQTTTPSLAGTGYADLGANASTLRQAQLTQAIKNALRLAGNNPYYG
jgi:hypothetical protein